MFKDRIYFKNSAIILLTSDASILYTSYSNNKIIYNKMLLFKNYIFKIRFNMVWNVMYLSC